jgi:CRISPR system Cascade subunit CasD
VLGLVGAALGVARDDREQLARLAGLSMAVLVEKPGVLRSDYQTAGGGSWPGRKRYGVYKASGAASGDATLSTRHYLADASFVVALSGDDGLVGRIDAALRAPRWTLWLGRKGYVASAPIAAGLFEGAAAEVLRQYASESAGDRESRLVVETGVADGEPRMDVPVDFTPDHREFGIRYVRSERLAPRQEAPCG